jgi:hypothetical protein
MDGGMLRDDNAEQAEHGLWKLPVEMAYRWAFP